MHNDKQLKNVHVLHHLKQIRNLISAHVHWYPMFNPIHILHFSKPYNSQPAYSICQHLHNGNKSVFLFVPSIV